ncbi:RDD family protein [Trichocoleus sp. FACHB-90]|uniref:RDD family protein n=1 Tax=Cyanophyceae TaxID=3028117 RepID=UPI0016882F0E|nr:RDD family protein [Trichocoleus sp. FACHB-90]MBD1925065.1 RDD family protein [Trichocoleus sp. FACHB-90]
MPNELATSRLPKVPIERRCAAYAIDFVAIWLISLPFGGKTPGLVPIAQIVVFIVAWLGLRVLLPAKNKGQSLGRWAMDMKVLDPKFRKTPGLFELSKREGILGLASLLAMIGLSIGVTNGLSLLLLVTPLAVDFGVAVADAEWQQAFHDRVARTCIVQTRRGFSLDIRLKKIVAKVTNRMK